MRESLYDSCMRTGSLHLLREWHPTKNGKRTPDSLTYGSQEKVWWRCNHGHVWQTAVYSRAGPQRCGYPVCAGRVDKKRMERYAAMMAGAALLDFLNGR